MSFILIFHFFHKMFITLEEDEDSDSKAVFDKPPETEGAEPEVKEEVALKQGMKDLYIYSFFLSI